MSVFKSTKLWLQWAEVSGEWKNLPSKEREDVYASPDIIYGGACVIYTGVWWRNLKETVRLEDLGVDMIITLKLISLKWD